MTGDQNSTRAHGLEALAQLRKGCVKEDDLERTRSRDRRSEQYKSAWFGDPAHLGKGCCKEDDSYIFNPHMCQSSLFVEIVFM